MAPQPKDSYAEKLLAEINRAGNEQADHYLRIDQLGARIEALEDALKLYTENRSSEPTEKAEDTVRPVRKRRVLQRSKTRFGFVLERIKLSGSRGLNIAEMVEQCKTANVPIKRSSLRSQLFDRKQKGILVYADGRYKHASAVSPGNNGHDDSSQGEAPSNPHQKESLGASIDTGLAIQ